MTQEREPDAPVEEPETPAEPEPTTEDEELDDRREGDVSEGI